MVMVLYEYHFFTDALSALIHSLHGIFSIQMGNEFCSGGVRGWRFFRSE